MYHESPTRMMRGTLVENGLALPSASGKVDYSFITRLCWFAPLEEYSRALMNS